MILQHCKRWNVLQRLISVARLSLDRFSDASLTLLNSHSCRVSRNCGNVFCGVIVGGTFPHLISLSPVSENGGHWARDVEERAENRIHEATDQDVDALDIVFGLKVRFDMLHWIFHEELAELEFGVI